MIRQTRPVGLCPRCNFYSRCDANGACAICSRLREPNLLERLTDALGDALIWLGNRVVIGARSGPRRLRSR